MLRGKEWEGTHKPSITYIRHLLKAFNIHHSKDASICPTCRLLQDFGHGENPPPHLQDQAAVTRWRNKFNKHKAEHHHISKTQHNPYTQDKNYIINNAITDEIIITQDSPTPTTIRIQSRHDCIHISYNPNELDNIQRTYYHYVGYKGYSNDVWFVMAVWEDLLKIK